jgi:hypothetical protein
VCVGWRWPGDVDLNQTLRALSQPVVVGHCRDCMPSGSGITVVLAGCYLHAVLVSAYNGAWGLCATALGFAAAQGNMIADADS